MLERVEVVTEQGVVLMLSLRDISSGFSVQDIEGLDPVEAVIVSSPFGAMDGEYYQSSRRGKRNIILTLGYEPDYASVTMQELRTTLYKFFMPKTRVLLRFFQTDEPMVQIYGRIESFKSSKFAKEPTAVISILNFDPDFYNPTPKIISSYSISNTAEQSYVYSGTVETGIILRVTINRPDVTEFSLVHRMPDSTLRKLEFSSASPLIPGDVISISTIPGNKYATLTRGGVNTNFLYGISPQSTWIDFYPGLNLFRLNTEGAALPYQIELTAKYGGL